MSVTACALAAAVYATTSDARIQHENMLRAFLAIPSMREYALEQLAKPYVPMKATEIQRGLDAIGGNGCGQVKR